jgi:hypothetical protein
VYFPGHNLPHQLLMLDAAKAWDLVFDDTETFNRWAEERYRWVKSSLAAVTKTTALPLPMPATVAAAKS